MAGRVCSVVKQKFTSSFDISDIKIWNVPHEYLLQNVGKTSSRKPRTTRASILRFEAHPLSGVFRLFPYLLELYLKHCFDFKHLGFPGSY